MRQEKTADEIEELRRIIHSFEQKSMIDEQKAKRLEQENRAWIEKSLQLIKDEFNASKKKDIQGDKNFYSDFSESLSKLSQMIRNTKENFEVKLQANQVHNDENLKGIYLLIV